MKLDSSKGAIDPVCIGKNNISNPKNQICQACKAKAKSIQEKKTEKTLKDRTLEGEKGILELIKEHEEIERRHLNRLALLEKLAKSKKNKADINDTTMCMLKNARLEIKDYQLQASTTLSKIKEEYNQLKQDPIPLLISEFKDIDEHGIDYFLEEIESLHKENKTIYNQMAMIGFTFMPLLRAFELHEIASNLSDAQTYIEDSEAYGERIGNEITQTLRAIQKGFAATMVLSTGDLKTKRNFLAYCRFGFGF
jgi:hypothetical protein